MEKKFNKTKYAAVVLASTMALSTVASVTPQAFGESTITAQAAAGTEVKGEELSKTVGEETTKYDGIKVNSKEFSFTISGGKVTIKDSKDKEIVKDAVKDDVVKIEKKNYKVTTLDASGETPAAKLVLTELKEVKPADVTKAIKALDITKAAVADGAIVTTSAFETAVKAIEDDLELLTADELKKLESSTKLLAAYKALGNDKDLVAAIQNLPTEADVTATTYSVSKKAGAENETPDVKEIDIKKGKTTVKGVQGINTTVEEAVEKLEAYKALYATATAKENTSAKDNKTVLKNVQATYSKLVKKATESQKAAAAEYNVDPFELVYKALTEGAEYNILENEEIKVSNKGVFKVDGDAYTASVVDNKLTVTNVLGEEEELTAVEGSAGAYTFVVDNYDEKNDDGEKVGDSTLNDTIQISIGSDNALTVAKVKETVNLGSAVPVLPITSKTDITAYKALKAGTGKYNDAQIELIQEASRIFKKLDSAAKKLVKSEDQKKLKEYETALKAQQSLEKKFIAQDVKGVTDKIKSLKYGAVDKKTGNALYSAELVKAAEKAYNDLTPKFKKKVSASVVADLNAHLDTYELIEDIDALTEDALLTSTKADDEAFTGLKADVAAAKTKYNGLSTSKTDKVGKKKQGLVKNYKNLTALEKLIETQEKYYTANAGDLKTWKEALAAITGTEDVQVINNKFAAGETVYEVEYDKKAKTAKIKDSETEAVKENDKGVITLTPAEDYTVTVTKGKVKVDKTVAAAGTFALKSLNSKMTVEAFDALAGDALYTAAQIKAIEDARAANKALSKESKKFLNATDEKTLKSYETDVKTQKALEKKSLSAAVKAINDGVKNLKYTDSTYATKVTEVKGLLTAFGTKYAGDTATLGQIKDATKATLTDHEAVSAVKATLDATPKATDITAETLSGNKTTVSAARTAFDALSDAQKKIAKDAETAIKAAEEKIKTLEAAANSNPDAGSGDAE